MNSITKEYYMKCLDLEHSDNLDTSGVCYVESGLRDQVLKGYSKPFLVYIYKEKDKVIVSYSKSVKGLIAELESTLTVDMSAESIKSLLLDKGFNLKHNILYEFKKTISSSKEYETRKLNNSDLPLFIDYFKINNPDVNNVDWLDDYFYEMCESELCYGTFSENKLVSIAECPNMPFLEDKIRHIGISTLNGFKRKGYATHTVKKSIENLLTNNIVPQWECKSDNIGSIKVAENCGFEKIADAIILTEK